MLIVISMLGAQTHEGYPLVDKSNNPTKKVHVFGEKWRIQGEGYEAETYNPVQYVAPSY